MQSWWVLLMVGCGDNLAVVVDARPDARPDAELHDVCLAPGGTVRAHCANPMMGTMPPECERTSDVNWIVLPTNSCVPMASAPIPAGFYMEDPTIGCFFVVVRDHPLGFQLDATSHGCGWSLGLPDSFTCDACGSCHGVLETCMDIRLDTEGCYAQRTTSATGAIRLHVDPEAHTLTVAGPVFDTSSSPSGCDVCP